MSYEFHRRDRRAHREILPQEAVTEGVLTDGITEYREGQLILRRSIGIGGQPGLHGVDHHRPLRQPEHGARTVPVDRLNDVVRTLGHRLADARTVQTETRISLIDAREQPLKGVALDLAGGVVDLLAL